MFSSVSFSMLSGTHVLQMLGCVYWSSYYVLIPPPTFFFFLLILLSEILPQLYLLSLVLDFHFCYHSFNFQEIFGHYCFKNSIP